MKTSETKQSNIKIAMDKKIFHSINKPSLESQLSSRCSPQLFSLQNRVSKASTPSQNTDFSSKQILKKSSCTALPSNPTKKIETQINKKQPINSADVSQCYQDNQELIQHLMQENMQLQQQNMAKDSLISQLIVNSTRNSPNYHRANTSNNELRFFAQSKQQEKKKIRSSADHINPLGFTFCNTEEHTGLRTLKTQKSPNRLPEEFQVQPKLKRYFV